MVTTMSFDRETSTPREDARTKSPEWRKKYEEYLQSPAWRRTRNGALHRAGFVCQKCGTKDRLQAHHKTYERLGRERDEDLEVLCAVCHEDHHVAKVQTQMEVQRIFLAVVSDTLERERFTCMSDLLEAVKVSCARRKIKYSDPEVWKAVRRMDLNRRGILDAPKPEPPPEIPADGRPVTHLEALELLRKAGWNLKDFMQFPTTPSDQAERVKFQAEQIRAEIRAHDKATTMAMENGRRVVSVIGRGRFKKVIYAD